jgi:hypothetical protein
MAIRWDVVQDKWSNLRHGLSAFQREWFHGKNSNWSCRVNKTADNCDKLTNAFFALTSNLSSVRNIFRWSRSSRWSSKNCFDLIHFWSGKTQNTSLIPVKECSHFRNSDIAAHISVWTETEREKKRISRSYFFPKTKSVPKPPTFSNSNKQQKKFPSETFLSQFRVLNPRKKIEASFGCSSTYAHTRECTQVQLLFSEVCHFDFFLMRDGSTRIDSCHRQNWPHSKCNCSPLCY